MIYLICGDIHGNLPALELLLKKEHNNYDYLICHGDVVNYGPWSNECVTLLNSLKNKTLLKGNHESYFLSGIYIGSNIIAKEFFNFCFPKFISFNLIKSYELTFNIKNFIVQHTIFDKYIFKDTDVDKIENNFIIGHSHQQYNRIVNGKHIINTGSVGQNRTFINCINYILYDDINYLIDLKYLIYDHNLIIDKMISENYPKICIEYYKSKKTM